MLKSLPQRLAPLHGVWECPPSRASLVAGATALLVAVSLKAFYSNAGADQLLWILGPSAWLARVFGGLDLIYENGAGYISQTFRLVIGPACAGLNFLVISFLCVYFSFARRSSSKARWLTFSLLAAYLATVIANGLRIFLSAHLWVADIYSPGLTPETVHRVGGIAVYYASLLALYVSVESYFGKRGSGAAPLLWYIGISLGVPLIGRYGSGLSSEFTRHAVWVLSIATLFTLVKALPYALRNRIH